MPRWTRPQAWNSGAATTTVSRARNGTSTAAASAESTPPATPRARALRPPGRARRQDDLPAGVARRHQRARTSARAADRGELACRRRVTAAPHPATTSANSSSWRTARCPRGRRRRRAAARRTRCSGTRCRRRPWPRRRGSCTNPRPLRARIPTVHAGPDAVAAQARGRAVGARHSCQA